MKERDLYRVVGNRIRQARLDLGLTQEALAEAVSLTRTSITNIEKGRQNLLVHKLISFADALQVAPADLLPQSGDGLGGTMEQIVSNQPDDTQQFLRDALHAGSKPRRIHHEHVKSSNSKAG